MISFKKIIAGLGTTLALGGGGVAVDANKLSEVPIDKTEVVAEYSVKAKQVGNVVETTFPWKDQAGIKVDYDMGEPTLAEKLKDERDAQVITEKVDFGDGGFKIDILLKEKPTTNTFCYTIQGAENYNFFYQPPLTEEEIADGASRPPEIEGSYAVYHKTLANHVEGKENYATGKVMHIPRPRVWEVNNKEKTTQWADLSYDERGLCVTVPQDFLDKANYPVRVDPTFGYTSVGASSSNSAANELWGSIFTSPSDATTATNIKVYSGSSFRGLKGILVLQSTLAILTNGVTPGSDTSSGTWNTRTFATPPTLSGSTVYLIGGINNGVTDRRYDAGDSGQGYTDTTNSYSTPTNPTDASTNSNKYSIYATYTASGGGGGTTPNQNIILFE